MRLSPLAMKQWQRFRSIKRGYWSAIMLVVLLVLSLFAEVFVNNRALVVSYEGQLYFPTYAAFIPGRTFGLDYEYETNYRDLARSLKQDPASGNWVLMPPVPYSALENDLSEVLGAKPFTPPSIANGHYLGTDTTGRDVLARLFYGFRLAMGFALLLLVSNYVIGIAVGCAMGSSGPD